MADEKPEDYELMPHHEIQSLRDELDRLKKNPASSDKTLQQSMENLTRVINDLMTLFKNAEQSMKFDMEEENKRDKRIDDVVKHLKTLEDQNEKIAQAMVTIADMVEKVTSNKEPSSPPPGSEPIGRPPAASQGDPFSEPKPPLPGAVPSLDDPFSQPPQFEGIPPPPGNQKSVDMRPPMGAPPSAPPQAPKKKFSLFQK